MDPPSRISNRQIAAIFYEVADILDLKSVKFKPERTGGLPMKSRHWEKIFRSSPNAGDLRRFPVLAVTLPVKPGNTGNREAGTLRETEAGNTQRCP